jgi:hypothetical protein
MTTKTKQQVPFGRLRASFHFAQNDNLKSERRSFWLRLGGSKNFYSSFILAIRNNSPAFLSCWIQGSWVARGLTRNRRREKQPSEISNRD